MRDLGRPFLFDGAQAEIGAVPIEAVGGAVETITCSVGGATASGLSAEMSQTVACSTGVATGSGLTAGITEIVTAAVGVSTASGLVATISTDATETISCAVGVATGSGLVADVVAVVAGSVGGATASGLQASIASSQAIACNVGVAIASGLACEIRGGLVAAQDAGGGPDDVYDAPYLAYVNRVERNRVAARNAGRAADPKATATAAREAVDAAPIVGLPANGIGLQRRPEPARIDRNESPHPIVDVAEVQNIAGAREEAPWVRQEREMREILTMLLVAA